MGRQPKKIETKYANFKEIEGENPKGRKYQYTDKHWRWQYDNKVKGLPSEEVLKKIEKYGVSK